MKARLLYFMMFYAISVNAQTPQLVYDFQSGPNGSDPIYLTPFNGKLYLTADDGTNGRELWSYDGSSAPVMVYNLNPGAASSGMVAYNEKMAVLGGNMYFSANNGSTGNELFKYDGTNPPVLAYDFGPGNSTPRSLTVV